MIHSFIVTIDSYSSLAPQEKSSSTTPFKSILGNIATDKNLVENLDCSQTLSDEQSVAQKGKPTLKHKLDPGTVCCESMYTVVDAGFHEGGKFHYKFACEIFEAMPTVKLRPCPSSST